MTNRTKFILVVVGLLAVFVLIEYRMPRKFSWVPTFSHTDDQPFGCLLFDSLLTVSMPKGYTVTNRTLWQMKKDSVFTTPKGVMVITTEDVDALMGDVLDLASKGNIMLVATTDLYRWCDSLGIDFRYHSKFKIANITGKLPEMDTLCLADSFTPDSGITVCEQLIECTLTIPDSVDCQVLARLYDTTEQPDDADTLVSSVVAATFPMGKGELILVSVPLLLTNYGTVSGDCHRLTALLMGRMKHLPVIRTERYMQVTAQPEQSPLYVLLHEPPLRWAVYLAMLTMLTFCFFTARRRQRVIPVMGRPGNGNLEFVRLIGTLFWQQHDNAALVAKKLAYTADILRRDMGIDINDTAALPQLAAHTGRNVEELRLLLHHIRQAASGDYAVSDAEMKIFIDEMDGLVHSS